MYKNKEFDYDLWTSADGRRFARVRITGEVCEINNETMRILRCEEKRIYREQELKKSLNSENVVEKTKASIMYPLSFEISDDENDEDSSWLQSNEAFEEKLMAQDLENKFLELLTDYQKEVFLFVLKNGESQSSFADRFGIKKQSVNEAVTAIRKKAKKFFNLP